MASRQFCKLNGAVTRPTCSKSCMNSETPIWEVALINHARCFEYLIQTRGDRRDRIIVNWSLLLANVAEKGCNAVIQVMLDLKTSSTEEFGIHGLHVAAFFGQITTVETFTKYGRLDVNTRNNFGFTSLYYASQNGHYFVVNYLLEHGADVSIETADGQQCLHEASSMGHLTICKLLIEKLADVNAVDSANCTPLHGACIHDNAHVVRLLLDECADVDAQDAKDRTALWYACRYGYTECAEALLANNADTGIFSESGNQALHVAAHNGHCGVIELLLQHGAEMTPSYANNKTPIELALSRRHENAASILKARGGRLPPKIRGQMLEDLDLEKTAHRHHLSTVKNRLIEVLKPWRPAYILWYRNILTAQKHHRIFEDKDPFKQSVLFYDLLYNMSFSEYKKAAEVFKELELIDVWNLLSIKAGQRRRTSPNILNPSMIPHTKDIRKLISLRQ